MLNVVTLSNIVLKVIMLSVIMIAAAYFSTVVNYSSKLQQETPAVNNSSKLLQ